MCYDISAQLKTQLFRAKHIGNQTALKEITEIIKEKELVDFYRASGFEHPYCVLYDESSTFVTETKAVWGQASIGLVSIQNLIMSNKTFCVLISFWHVEGIWIW